MEYRIQYKLLILNLCILNMQNYILCKHDQMYHYKTFIQGMQYKFTNIKMWLNILYKLFQLQLYHHILNKMDHIIYRCFNNHNIQLMDINLCKYFDRNIQIQYNLCNQWIKILYNHYKLDRKFNMYYHQLYNNELDTYQSINFNINNNLNHMQYIHYYFNQYIYYNANNIMNILNQIYFPNNLMGMELYNFNCIKIMVQHIYCK